MEVTKEMKIDKNKLNSVIRKGGYIFCTIVFWFVMIFLPLIIMRYSPYEIMDFSVKTRAIIIYLLIIYYAIIYLLYGEIYFGLK